MEVPYSLEYPQARPKAVLSAAVGSGITRRKNSRQKEGKWFITCMFLATISKQFLNFGRLC